MLRSLLFVPGDSERKQAKGTGSGADALILDLEDAVAASRKTAARALVRDFLLAHPRAGRQQELWVRINPLAEDTALADLAAVVAGAPDGIVLPKAGGPDDVARLGHYLAALEAREGLDRPIFILPVATETPAAPFRLPLYADGGLPRLRGLTWGAEDLSTALGASTNRAADGGWAFTYRMVRSMALLAAHAAGIAAIETLHADFRDEAGLRASSAEAYREGFTGRLAIHPDQVAVINEAFSPSEADLAFAQRVVELFAASPDSGTLALDGRMLDIPHLKQAKRILENAPFPAEPPA